mgnify:CR=1 FL=1
MKISPRSEISKGIRRPDPTKFTGQEQQEQLRSSKTEVMKRTISNELQRNSLKSRTLSKTLLLKRQTDAWLKFVREHEYKEYSFWEKVL